MVDTYVLFFHSISSKDIFNLKIRYYIYSVLEFPSFVEVIISKPYGYSSSKLLHYLVNKGLPKPVSLFNIDHRWNSFLYPSSKSNTKCNRMYTLIK